MVVSFRRDDAKFGNEFREFGRTDLFVCGFIQAKKPVRSTGKSGFV